jgi:PAS domain S-box-containing protein
MEKPRILLASKAGNSFSELQSCFHQHNFAADLVPIESLDLLVRHCAQHNFDLVIVEDSLTQFSLEKVLECVRASNPGCPVYILFDALDEPAIASAIQLGATSFGLSGNLPSLVNQLRTKIQTLDAPAKLTNSINPEQILHAFLQESTDSIWVKSKSGKYLLINPAGANFLRKPIDQIIGKNDYELFPPETAEKIVQSDRQVLLSGLTQTVEDLLVTPNGTQHTFMAVKGIFRDETGKVQGLIGTVRDITERKQTEETLRQSEERFRLLVEGVKDHAFYMLDTLGQISSWNTGAERLQGFQTQEILGQHFSCFYQQDPAPIVSPAKALLLTTENGYCEQECWQVRKDGSRYWANIIITPLYNQQRQLICFSAVVRDMTVQRQAEEALKYYAAKLEQSNQDLEHFATIASHDLQAPLRKVRVFAEMLQQYTTEEGQDISQRLQGSAEKMQHFITDLLELSRVNRKGKPFQSVDLNRVISRAQEDLELIIAESAASLESNELGWVYGDPFQLEQLCLNILGNSLKFRKPDQQTRITVQGGLLPNGYYQLIIEDNGIGFKEEYLERIFRPFERLHGHVQFPGTGMGLAICRKIVERHGGHITATSIEGQGSRFIISLPTETPPNPDAAPQFFQANPIEP